MFMSRFMLRGLMSLKYDDFPKHLDRSTCDCCRSNVELPKLDVAAPMLFAPTMQHQRTPVIFVSINPSIHRSRFSRRENMSL